MSIWMSFQSVYVLLNTMMDVQPIAAKNGRGRKALRFYKTGVYMLLFTGTDEDGLTRLRKRIVSNGILRG